MSDGTYGPIRHLPREELEDFAIRAALQINRQRNEASKGDYFVAMLVGFLLGALVAASGFLVGAGIG